MCVPKKCLKKVVFSQMIRPRQLDIEVDDGDADQVQPSARVSPRLLKRDYPHLSNLIDALAGHLSAVDIKLSCEEIDSMMDTQEEVHDGFDWDSLDLTEFPYLNNFSPLEREDLREAFDNECDGFELRTLAIIRQHFMPRFVVNEEVIDV